MERREFMTSVVGGTLAAGAAGAGEASAQTAAPEPRDDVWRQYICATAPGWRRLADYLQNAAIPALNRIGHSPVGAFEVVTGVPGPTAFVLVPLPKLASLGEIETKLRADPGGPRAGRRFYRRDRGRSRTFARRRRCSRPFPGSRSWSCRRRRPRKGRGCSSCAPTKARPRRRISPRSGCSRKWAKSRFQAGRADAGVLLEDDDRAAHAQPGLHAGLRRHGRTREGLGRLSQLSGVEASCPRRRASPTRRSSPHHLHLSAPGGGTRKSDALPLRAPASRPPVRHGRVVAAGLTVASLQARQPSAAGWSSSALIRGGTTNSKGIYASASTRRPASSGPARAQGGDAESKLPGGEPDGRVSTR